MSVLGVPNSPTCTYARLDQPKQGDPNIGADPVFLWGSSQRTNLSTHLVLMPEPAGPNFRGDMVPPLRPPEASFSATWDYSQSPLGTRGGSIIVLLISSLMSTYFQSSYLSGGRLNANMMYLMPIAEPASVNLVSNADASLSTHLLLNLVFTWHPGWAVPVNGKRRRESSQPALSLITCVTSSK